MKTAATYHPLPQGSSYALRAVMLSCLIVSHACLAGEVHLQLAFNPADLKLEKSGEFTQAHFKDCPQPGDKPGLPLLPAKYVWVVIPPGAKPTDIVVTSTRETLVASNVLVYPAQPPRLTTEPNPQFAGPNPSVYGSTTRFPESAAVIQGEQILHGCKLVAIRLNPLSYTPALRELLLATEITATLAYEVAPAKSVASPRFMTHARRNDIATMVANPEDVDGFVPQLLASSEDKKGASSADSGATNDAVYLLITSGSLSNAFQPLVDRRTAQGKPGKLVTVEWIQNNYSGLRPDGGTDVPTKMRNCIEDYYQNHGTRYVALGGDETVVPVRYCISCGGTEIPCDLYYTGLDGTWDANTNGSYGEIEDNVDFASEVCAGRILVSTAAQVTNYINKVATYEDHPSDGFANSMLMQGALGDRLLSGSARSYGFQDHQPVDLSEVDSLGAYWTPGWGIQEFWQAVPLHYNFPYHTSWDTNTCGDLPESDATAVQILSRGYHHVLNFSHGNMGMFQWVNESVADGLTNSQSPSIFFVIGCNTASFDSSVRCIAEALFNNPHGGAVAYIGCVRSDELRTDDAREFYRQLYGVGADAIAEAFARSRTYFAGVNTADNGWRDLLFIFNLFSDPALQIKREESGRHLQLLSPQGCEVIPVDSDMLLRWNACGTAFASNETVRLEYSPDSGRNWSPVPGASALPCKKALFVWENPGLPGGSHYRFRVTANSAPATSDASSRDVTLAGPFRLLTVKSTGVAGQWIWIAGTHPNYLDYNYAVMPGDHVQLTAPSMAGMNFNGWSDVNGNLITHNTRIDFLMPGNKTITANYSAAGALRDYYVNDAVAKNGFAPGDDEKNDGTSPASPLSTMQQVIDRYSDVATVNLCDGTYLQNLVLSKTDSRLPLLTFRGAGPDQTIVDGQQLASCVWMYYAGAVTFADLTFQNGLNQDPAMQQRGGGIYSDWTALTVSNCAFANNQAASDGGGIYSHGGPLSVSNSRFERNLARVWSGGGVAASKTTLQVSNCEFIANSAGYNGGGIGAWSCDLASVVASRFQSNRTAFDGGAIGIWNSGSSLTNRIAGNVICGNTSSHSGGAVALGSLGQANLDNNFVLMNTAVNEGGGILAWYVNSLCLNRNNISANTSSYGGALLSTGSFVLANRCVFSNNSAGSGGGLYHWDRNGLTLSSCLVSGNSAAQYGGGLQVDSGALSLTNCTLFANHASVAGGGLNLSATASMVNCLSWGNLAPSGKELAAHGSATATLAFSDFEGGRALILADPGTTVTWDATDLAQDPLFLSGTTQCHLDTNSICRDAGLPGFAGTGICDLDGEPRVLGGRVDIGADEVSGLAPLWISADCDPNGLVLPGTVDVMPGCAASFFVQPANYFHIAAVLTNGQPALLPGGSGTCGSVFDWANVAANSGLHVTFAPDLATYSVPKYWLASYGWTNAFDQAALNIGINGIPVWQSYVAGLNPTNINSRFVITGSLDLGDSVVSFATVSNRLYSVEYLNQVNGGDWQNLITDLPGSGQTVSISDTNSASTAKRFYRAKVKLAE